MNRNMSVQDFLKIGTCSWKYDSWIGLIYTSADKQNYLQAYSTHYSTVEIDQWFWSLFEGKNPLLPNKNTVEEYLNSVPANFEFTIKVPNSITLTHYYKSKKDNQLHENPYFLSKDLFYSFLERLTPIHNKIGQLIFQFEYLNKQKMANQNLFIDRFGDFIKDCPADFSYAVETRNPQYLNEEYFSFLKSENLRHVFLQGYYMPSIVSVFNKYKNYISKSTVIRLHGPNRKEIERITGNHWSDIIAPKDAELADIVKMIQELIEKNVEIFININNHYEGSAPKTINKIKSLLQSKT